MRIVKWLAVAVLAAVPAFGNQQMGTEALEAGASVYVQKSQLAYSMLGSVVQNAIKTQEIIRGVRQGQHQLVHTERQAALFELTVALQHHLNNLLTPLSVHAQMLLDRLKDQPELRQYVEKIYDQVEQIEDLVRRIRRAREDELVEYERGLKMIDLSPKKKEP